MTPFVTFEETDQSAARMGSVTPAPLWRLIRQWIAEQEALGNVPSVRNLANSVGIAPTDEWDNAGMRLISAWSGSSVSFYAEWLDE